MNKIFIILVLCIWIYIWIYMIITRKELFTKVKVHSIGNTLSSYFTSYIYSCKNNKQFEINTDHKSEIIKNLPSSLPIRKIDIDVNMIENHIEESTLWESNFKIWKDLQPVVRHCINSSLEKSKIVRPKYDCVIHFRCSDTPFVRHVSYHLLKYSWYRKAICVALRYKKIRKIHILMCNNHIRHKLSYLCNNLVTDLQDFISRTFDIPSIVICNSSEEDFSIMYNSKVLISGGISSFSFFAGLASDNLFILPTFEKDDDSEIQHYSCRKNMIFIRKEFIKHKNIYDYSNIKNVLSCVNMV